MATFEFPDDRFYTAEHEWVTLASPTELPDAPVRVGITGLAADNLGELVYLDLPAVGTQVSAGQTCGELESTKTVSDLFCPVSGAVTEINDAAVAEPSLVSTDPYGTGWLFTVQVSSLGPVLSAAEYAEKNG
jgi:glycine cleavage system H protein